MKPFFEKFKSQFSLAALVAMLLIPFGMYAAAGSHGRAVLWVLLGAMTAVMLAVIRIK